MLELDDELQDDELELEQQDEELDELQDEEELEQPHSNDVEELDLHLSQPIVWYVVKIFRSSFQYVPQCGTS